MILITDFLMLDISKTILWHSHCPYQGLVKCYDMRSARCQSYNGWHDRDSSSMERSRGRAEDSVVIKWKVCEVLGLNIRCVYQAHMVLYMLHSWHKCCGC